MGCISSKTDINDLHHNIFQVMNVDELGNRLNPGQLEITETDLVLYQRRKAPVKWPLRCLRRYGFDAELFSFESGRRCPTGPGIYAFRCQRAEQLFNLLQTHIQVRNNAGEDAVSRDFPAPPATGPAPPVRENVSGDSNYLDPTPVRPSLRGAGNLRFTAQNGVTSSRLDSVGSSSNGPLSPQGTTSPSPPLIPVTNTMVISSVSSSNPSMHYANEELFSACAGGIEPSENNNKKPLRQSHPTVSTTMTSLSGDSSAKEKPISRLSVDSGDGGSTSIADDTSTAMASYVNVDLSNGPLSPTYSLEGDSSYAHLELVGDSQPVYMNIIPGPENGRVICPDFSLSIRTKPTMPVYGTLPSPQEWEPDESKRCYANLQPGEIEVPRSFVPKRMPGNTSVAPSQSQHLSISPSANVQRQVNYIVLDLDQNKSESAGGNGTLLQQQPPTSPIGSASPSLLPVPAESPPRASEGYATIDFNKTVALSHSVNPSMDNDSEGSRKTRHNSTISDLYAPPTRHSSSD